MLQNVLHVLVLALLKNLVRTCELVCIVCTPAAAAAEREEGAILRKPWIVSGAWLLI